MCNLPQIEAGLKQVAAASSRYSGGVLFCQCSHADAACGGESEQGVVVNIARITRSCPTALNTPQSRVSFVT